MTFSQNAKTIAGAWGGLVLVVIALLAILYNDHYPVPVAVPILFWTYFSLFLICATGCALGLRHDRAAFWRTIMLTLLTLMAKTPSQYVLMRQVSRWSLSVVRLDDWEFSVLVALLGTTAAILTATISLLLGTKSLSDRSATRFNFRLWHLFALSSVVAITLVALRYASPGRGEIAGWILVSARIAAVIALGARRGTPALFWGFLAGSFGWELLIDYRMFALEWSETLPLELTRHRADWPTWHQSELWRHILPLYAGLATGVLAATLYRPPTSSAQ